MTKERRLAIEMWEYVKSRCSKIETCKAEFLQKHPEIKWRSNCWFCQYFCQEHEDEVDGSYYSKTDMCSLNKGREEELCFGDCYWYWRYKNSVDDSEKKYVCDKIIKALRGEGRFEDGSWIEKMLGVQEDGSWK